MQNAAALIGNSSAGVREAPFLGVPSLNIGTRQTGRSLSPSITHVSAHDSFRIKLFLNEKWGKKYSRDTSFGVGDSVKRFTEILEHPQLFEKVTQKLYYDRN